MTTEQRATMNEIYAEIKTLRDRIESENLTDEMSETYNSLSTIVEENIKEE